MGGFVDSEKLKQFLLSRPDLAIEYLYEHYYSTLVHLAERRTNDRRVAEDIVQEALTEVWKKAERIGKMEGVMVLPYLLSIVRNKSVTFYKKNAKPENQKVSQPIEGITDPNATKEAEMIQLDRTEALHNLVATLPPRERQCIELRYFHEMSIEAIAIRLGVTDKAIEKNITSGLKRLRQNGYFVR